jgi:uncharacterized RDD family membrane protein YckC
MAKAGTSWCMVQLRPGGRPMLSMARAFASEKAIVGDVQPEGITLLQLVEATLNMSSLGIVDLYECARFAPGTNLLVVVDQFEELFRFAKSGARTSGPTNVNGEAVAFVNLLLEAQAQTQNQIKLPIYIVLTMRSDFLGECAQFDRLPEVMNEGQYLVPRLARSERRAAIEGPIGVAGAELSPVLLTRMVNDVGDNPDQLSILQHAINRTWAYWQQEKNGEGELALKHYEDPNVGTMLRALDLHAEETYAALKTEAERKICEKVFKTLTDKGTDARGIRRPMPLKHLIAICGASPDEINCGTVKDDVVAVLNLFRDPSRSFLMPPLAEPLDPDTVIDISHEILMRVWTRLRNWADEEAESASVYRRLAETAELHALKRAGLWGDPDLQTALEWKEKQQPNAAWAAMYRPGYDAAISFLAASKKVRDKQLAEDEFARQWRKVPPYLAAIFLAIFIVLFFRASPKIADLLKSQLVLDYNATAYKLDAPALGAGPSQGLSGSPWLSQLFSRVFRRETVWGIAEGLGYLIPALACLVGYLGLGIAGKWLYRRIAFEKIAKRIASRPVIPLKAPVIQNVPDKLTRREARAQASATLINAPPSGFWRIFAAGLLDLVVYLFIVLAWLIPLIIVAPSTDTTSGMIVMVVAYTGLPILACLYPSLMTWSRLGCTVGEWALGIRLIRRNGKPLSFLRVFARYVVSVPFGISIGGGIAGLFTDGPIIFLIATGLGSLCYLIQPFTPNKQALPDLITGTRFVRSPRKKKQAAPKNEAALPKPAAIPQGA